MKLVRVTGAGIAVTVKSHRTPPLRFLWTRIYGLQMGSWFIGSIYSSLSVPEGLKDIQDEIVDLMDRRRRLQRRDEQSLNDGQ